MACPAGYGTRAPPSLTAKAAMETEKKEFDSSSDTTAVSTENLPPITLYPPAAEPDILKKQIMPEPIVLFISGEYAILYQWLKYGLARGSVDHSDFGARVFQRAITTVRYLNTVVYGTRKEKEAITRIIHRYHSRVKGSGDEKGGAYYADDPELHRWTAATLYVAFSQVYELIFRPQSPEWHLQLMKECSIFATSLRMPTEMWFNNLEDIWKYWNHGIETLEVTPWARELMHQLLWPKMPLLLKPSSWWLSSVFRSFTIEMLPDKVREGYGLEKTSFSSKVYKFRKMNSRIMVRVVPRSVRHSLHPAFLWDMRRAVKRIESTGRW